MLRFRTGSKPSHRILIRLIALFLMTAALALVSAPAAFANYRYYWWNMNLSPTECGCDLGYFNHWFNRMYWGEGATYPGELYMHAADGTHYDHLFNGNAAFQDPGTYYDTPVCHNRDSVTHFVYYCYTEWG